MGGAAAGTADLRVSIAMQVVLANKMPTASGPVPFRRDRFGLVLLGLCLIHLALLVPALVYPDLNLDYPFMDGDSHEWIAAGLRLAGADVRDPGRSPGLPLTIGLLERLGGLPWLPVALQVLFHFTILAFYAMASRRVPRRAAFAVALALLLSHSLHGMSLQVMADVPASCLLFLASCVFVQSRYLASGLVGGLSALTQSAGLLAAVPAVLTVLIHRRQHLRSGRLWGGAFLFVALPGLWVAVRLATLGTLGGITARQWSLLEPGAGSTLFYGWSLLSLLGIPSALLLGAGLVLAARAARREDHRLFWFALFAVLAGFFLFLYGFDAKRFLVYLIWPAGLLAADALGRLRWRPAFAAAAGLQIAGAALPLPAEGNDPSWVGLWPLPPVYAHAPLTPRPSGSPVLQPSGIEVRTLPPSDLVRFANLRRVWSARRAWAARPRPQRLDPTQVAADRSALFLFLHPSDGGGRHRTLSRLGNALRKRAKFVPAAWLEPWADLLEVEPVGAIEPDYAVFRARLPAIEGSWLLAVPADGPLRSRWEARAGQASRPADPALRLALTRAVEIQRGLANDGGIVVLLTGDDPVRLYLPFLLSTPDLIVVEPDQERALLDRVAGAPRLSERKIAGAEIREIEILGRRAALVGLRAAPAALSRQDGGGGAVPGRRSPE